MQEPIKTAFITGAGSGIGCALAHALVDKGVAVYITDNNQGRLDVVEEELKASGGQVYSFLLDVSDKQAVFDMAAKANDLMGTVDIIFNNAGVSLSDTILKMNYQDFEWLMNINFWGVVHGTKAFLPYMLERQSGHIVNISSLFGLVGIPAQAAYCAAKHAVKGFNESLYYELQGTGVQIHSVHPGGVDTGIVLNGLQKNNTAGAIDVEKMQQRFKGMAVTSAKEAAEIILHGVDKGKFKILVGKDARLIDKLSRWVPNYWRATMAKRTKDKHAIL
tara:strand:- start:673 stop:1500 length:828 start_codon:yes stop_codon:yes gene_type:complete